MAWRERVRADGTVVEGQYELALACTCGNTACAFVDAVSAEAVGAPIRIFRSSHGETLHVDGELAEMARLRAWERLRRAAPHRGCDVCRETTLRWAEGSLFYVEHLPREVALSVSLGARRPGPDRVAGGPVGEGSPQARAAQQPSKPGT